MFTVQGKSYADYLTAREISLVRTYKGDIKRTQTGKVQSFPTSFVTVGFELSFLGPRAVIDELEQIFLSADVVELSLDYNSTNIKGKFSATSTQTRETRDKNERHKSLTVTVVSDGSNITDSSGNAFSVSLKVGQTTTVLKPDCYFGQVVEVSNTETSYKLNGVLLPKNNKSRQTVLVLGNVVLSSS
jgi:hypothetical protein